MIVKSDIKVKSNNMHGLVIYIYIYIYAENITNHNDRLPMTTLEPKEVNPLKYIQRVKNQ